MAQIRIRMRCFSRVCRRRNAIKKESQIRLWKENGARKKGWCQRSIEPTGRAAPFFYLGARAAEPLSTPARGLRPVKILLTWLPVWAPGSDGCSVTRKPLAGQADYGRPARLLGRCEGKTDDRKCLERAVVAPAFAARLVLRVQRGKVRGGWKERCAFRSISVGATHACSRCSGAAGAAQ